MDCSEGCPTAAVIFDVPGVPVLAAERSSDGLLMTVETEPRVEGCHPCGVLGVVRDRREHLLHDAPVGHRRVRVRRRKRIWRCADRECPVVTFSETRALAPPRGVR